MAYEPTNWQCGDTITAEKLNKIEEGIANSGGGGTSRLIVHSIPDIQTLSSTLDKTWQEIYDAFPNVMLDESDEGTGIESYTIFTLVNVGPVEGEEGFNYLLYDINSNEYKTDSPNGYPVRTVE